MSETVDPRGKHFQPREIAALCYEMGWTDAQKLLEAVSVCIAESNGYEKRRGPVHADGSVGNPDGSVDRGLWAINDKAHPSITDAMADDARQATAIARQIYKDRSYTFRAWASFTNGQYKGSRAMGYAFDGVANFLRLKNGFPL